MNSKTPSPATVSRQARPHFAALSTVDAWLEKMLSFNPVSKASWLRHDFVELMKKSDTAHWSEENWAVLTQACIIHAHTKVEDVRLAWGWMVCVNVLRVLWKHKQLHHAHNLLVSVWEQDSAQRPTRDVVALAASHNDIVNIHWLAKRTDMSGTGVDLACGAIFRNAPETLEALLCHMDPRWQKSKMLDCAVRQGRIEMVKRLLPLSQPRKNDSYILRNLIRQSHPPQCKNELLALLLPVSDVGAAFMRLNHLVRHVDQVQGEELLPYIAPHKIRKIVRALPILQAHPYIQLFLAQESARSLHAAVHTTHQPSGLPRKI